ncbi:Zinc finger, CCHC-type superfamily [Sesbania bispinosa]|nr:Zinc finger, CCHC-type superfamily [Sesbania bispinosa]
MRQLVCNKEGERSEKHLNRIDRKREAKAITRSNCKARLRIHLDYKSRKWIVSCFEPDHNHELTPASMVHLMPAYRGLSVADKAQVEGLHLYGVRTCHIMGLIMGQKGGYSDIGFCKKDLYNHIDKVNRAKIEDGDAFAALCYLQAKEKFEDEWNKVVEKHGVRENKHNELTSDFKSTYTQPVMTTALEKYELEASNVYTRNKFFDVRKEIEKVAAINVIDKSDVGNVVTLRLKRFGSPDSENVVQLDKSNGNLLCDYRLFESCGILCSHIFTAMKHEQVESIPASLICKRWTKLAIVDHISAVYAEEGDTTKKDLMRSGAVGAACNRLNKAARRNPHNFVRNIESIHKLAEQMERQEGIDLNSVDMSRVVRDPTVVKTKGAPRKNKKRTKKMRCSYCKRAGHTVRTCTKYATRDQLDTVVEEESSVETNEDSRDQSVSVNPNFSREVNHGQSKKKMKLNEKVKDNEAVKLTQESVNDLRSNGVNKAHKSGMSLTPGQNVKSDFNVAQMNTPSLPSLFVNNGYYSDMNTSLTSGPVHIRPSMIYGFGERLPGSRSQFFNHLNLDKSDSGLGRRSFIDTPRDG